MLLCYPDNFSKYIIIAPPLVKEYYAQKEMFDAFKKKPSSSKKIAYFSIGGEEKDDKIDDYIVAIKNHCLKIGDFPDITSRVEVIAGEGHVSVVPPSIWRGLKFFDLENKGT